MATSSSLTRRQWLPLIGLSAAAFVFNTSEFMPIGLLLDIGQSFALTESQTGIMISVYAWAVMLLSMPLMVLSSRFEFKKLLLGVIGLFTLGQFLSTIAPNFPFLIAARLVVATSHAIFWSIATIVAARLVDPKHQPIALSLIATGSSIAMIAGLPLGRMLGLAMGWRMTFASVGLISAAILLYLCLVMPKHEATERFTFRQLPSLLKNPILVSLYIVIAFIATGYYTGYSYIEPFMAQIANMSPSLITTSLTIFGLAGLAGSIIFSKVYDLNRFRFIAITLTGIMISLLSLQICASSFTAIIAICIIWGMCSTAFNVAFQSELIRYTNPSASAVAMSIYSGLFNLGIGTGTAIGGQVTDKLSVANVGYAGGIITAIGVAVAISALFCAIRHRETQTSTP